MQHRMHTQHGRQYVVLASFPADEVGREEAEDFIEQHPNTALLAEERGRLLLSDKRDVGITKAQFNLRM